MSDLQDELDEFMRTTEGSHSQTSCCAGCCRVADDAGEPIALEQHPLFDNLRMCHEDNVTVYRSEGNWILDEHHHENNCRCCGFDDHMLVECDGPRCRATFCHGCIVGHCASYGTAELDKIQRSVDDEGSPWLCFLCRDDDGEPNPYEVNAEALERFRAKRYKVPRASGGSAADAMSLSSDESSGEDSADESFTERADHRSDNDSDDEEHDTQRPAAAARSTGGRRRRPAPAGRSAGARATVFRCKTEYLVECTGARDPYVMIENVAGMSPDDRSNVQRMLKLDETKIDSVRFSFATRKRLYFTNFACQREADLPALEGSPTLSAVLAKTTGPVDEEELKGYFEDGVTDARFVQGGPQHATPFGALFGILIDE